MDRKGDREFTFCIGQKEIGDEEKREHIQAVVYHSQGLSFKKINKLLKGAHLAAFNDDGEAMMKYCQKSKTAVKDTQFQFGISPVKLKKRKAMDDMVSEIQAGTADVEQLFKTYGMS